MVIVNIFNIITTVITIIIQNLLTMLVCIYPMYNNCIIVDTKVKGL